VIELEDFQSTVAPASPVGVHPSGVPWGVCVHDTLIYEGEGGSHNIHIITGSGESRTYTNVVISAALKITSYLY